MTISAPPGTPDTVWSVLRDTTVLHDTTKVLVDIATAGRPWWLDALIALSAGVVGALTGARVTRQATLDAVTLQANAQRAETVRKVRARLRQILETIRMFSEHIVKYDSTIPFIPTDLEHVIRTCGTYDAIAPEVVLLDDEELVQRIHELIELVRLKTSMLLFCDARFVEGNEDNSISMEEIQGLRKHFVQPFVGAVKVADSLIQRLGAGVGEP